MKKNLPLDIHSSPERVILDLRKAGFKDVLVLGKYHYTFTRQQLPAHRHRHMLEICYCSKGEQRYEVNGKTYRVKGGDLFVTYPGEWHGTGPHREEKGELYWMIIRIDPAGQFLGFDGILAAAWQERLLQLPRHYKGKSSLKNMLEKIFFLFNQRKAPFTLIQLRHLIAGYLLEVIACSEEQTGEKKPARLETIDIFLKEKLDEPIALQDLANIAGLSLSRFKSWFKTATGMTPLDYVLRYKLKIARQLLEDDRLSVTEIAFKTGFQNPQYFATVFRKFTGMRPSDCRGKTAPPHYSNG
ncbi:MAG TPA: AraC family transcriptional regulator [Puia sp.]|jgi:AraC-like DNA-binding protein